MTYALRDTRSLPAHALAALMSRKVALTALAVLGLSGDPFHDPFHARGRCVTPSCSLCAARHATRDDTASRAACRRLMASAPNAEFLAWWLPHRYLGCLLADIPVMCAGDEAAAGHRCRSGIVQAERVMRLPRPSRWAS